MITLDMLIPIAAKGALVLLLAAVFALLLLNRSAAFRHMVWAGGLMALLVLPALSFIVPELPVPGVVTVQDERVAAGNASTAGEGRTAKAEGTAKGAGA